MSALQLVLWLAGSIVIGLVVGWALNAITKSYVEPVDYSDIEQADKESARD